MFGEVFLNNDVREMPFLKEIMNFWKTTLVFIRIFIISFRAVHLGVLNLFPTTHATSCSFFHGIAVSIEFNVN